MIKNAKDILKTRRDIIKAYEKSRFEKEPNLISFDDDDEGGDDDEDGDDDEGRDDDEDGDDDEGEDGDDDDDDDDDEGGDGEDENKKLPDWVGVSRKRFNEIKNTIRN